MKIAIYKNKSPLSVHVIWGALIISFLLAIRIMPQNRCLFHHLTGYPCLTCGISRAADAFWCGEFWAMFCFNPLAVTFCTGLFLFSLLKLLEYILHIKVEVNLSQKAVAFSKVFLGLAVAADWLFLIVSKR